MEVAHRPPRPSGAALRPASPASRDCLALTGAPTSSAAGRRPADRLLARVLFTPVELTQLARRIGQGRIEFQSAPVGASGFRPLPLKFQNMSQLQMRIGI